MCLPRAVLASVAAALMASGLLGAQAAPTAPQQQPTFRAATNLVRVDVTILDKHGQPLTGLTRDDFVVSEDGVPQAIDAFRFIEANGQPTDDLSLPIRSREHAYAEAARDDVRVFVIFWDEYHIGQFEPAIRGRAALTDLVLNAFGPTDLVAVTDQLTPSDAIELTRDRRALAETVAKLTGRRGVYLPPRSAMEEAQLYRASNIEGLRSQVSRSALEATVGFLGTIKEGRKAVLLVTEDFGPMGGPADQADWLRDFIRQANQNNTAVYTFDPRSLGLMNGVLMSVSADTGAEGVRSNAPAKRLLQMVTENSAFYLLGYSSSRNPADGKFHKIDVRVDRPGIDVHARRGYFAPTLSEIASARASAARAEAPPEVSHALSTLVESPEEFDGDLWVGTEPGADHPMMTVAWAPSQARADLSIRIRATSPEGRVFFDHDLNGSATFDVSPGEVDIRQTLTDTGGASLGARATSVTVPDYGHESLAFWSPRIFRARTGIELRDIESNRTAVPFAGHDFDRSDRVIIRAGIAGTLAPSSTPTARLLNKGGVALVDLPLVRRPDGQYEASLPIASLARGEYLVEFSAVSGGAHAQALVPLRVK
ncbi:MAG TPA: VWA domain-containing protein [Vicinamibacterales bacterium]|nr:VWA domain-containing protein [Vicinamibacterales bacterium]